jgi:predicted kinase
VTRPALLILTGPPAAGKSRLIKELARRLDLPLVAKDTIKEALMDVLPADTVEASETLGRAAFAVLYSVAGSLLDARVGAILEAAFHREQAERELGPLVERADAAIVHISAPGEIISDRYRKRAEAGSRHPGHHDRERVGELPEQLERGVYEPPELGIPVLRVDTSQDRYRPGVEEIVGWCRERLTDI